MNLFRLIFKVLIFCWGFYILHESKSWDQTKLIHETFEYALITFFYMLFFLADDVKQVLSRED